MKRRTDLLELLTYIDPSGLSYQEWLNVGMALNHEGYALEDWDAWSRRDPERYHAGECASKWRGFHGSANPVTGGTIVQMARENGWAPQTGGPMDWDSPISAGEGAEGATGSGPERQLIQCLRALFKPDEFVGYVTKSHRRADEKGVRWLPSEGNWDRTAGRLIEALEKCGGDIGAAMGDWAPEAGAWMRFNPLDGKGCKDKNVTDFRHALVECDELPVEEQMALIKKLNLPVACLTHSGKRSLHAIVRVDAADYEEHQSRVRLLYKICRENGLKVDAQNKNPSRLSRMPGVTRNGREQSLIAVNMGARGWEEWLAFMECEGSERFGYTFWQKGCPGCDKYERCDLQGGDAISHPAHYCAGRKYEPVKVIQDWGLSFCLGNALKYIARAGRKDGCSRQEDLRKAMRYLEFELQAEAKEM